MVISPKNGDREKSSIYFLLQQNQNQQQEQKEDARLEEDKEKKPLTNKDKKEQFNQRFVITNQMTTAIVRHFFYKIIMIFIKRLKNISIKLCCSSVEGLCHIILL